MTTAFNYKDLLTWQNLDKLAENDNAIKEQALTFNGAKTFTGNIAFTAVDAAAFTVGGSNDDFTVNSSTHQMLAGYSSVSAPAWTMKGDLDTGIHFPAANSLSLVTAGAAALSIQAAGIVNQALQPSFLVTNGTGATDVTGDGTVYTVPWVTEIYDQGANFASNTFTAPITGRYFLQASILMSDIPAGGGTSYLALITSNRTYRLLFINAAGVQAIQQYLGSVIADMDANDTVTAQIIISSSTKTADLFNSAEYNFFSGSLIN